MGYCDIYHRCKEYAWYRVYVIRLFNVYSIARTSTRFYILLTFHGRWQVVRTVTIVAHRLHPLFASLVLPPSLSRGKEKELTWMNEFKRERWSESEWKKDIVNEYSEGQKYSYDRNVKIKMYCISVLLIDIHMIHYTPMLVVTNIKNKGQLK